MEGRICHAIESRDMGELVTTEEGPRIHIYG